MRQMAPGSARAGLRASMLFLGAVWTWLLLSPCAVRAMRADHMAQLRQETVDMFYHGYDNYMKHAFPEDEVNSHKSTLTVVLGLLGDASIGRKADTFKHANTWTIRSCDP